MQNHVQEIRLFVATVAASVTAVMGQSTAFPSLNYQFPFACHYSLA
jgi:hypothetical protein